MSSPEKRARETKRDQKRREKDLRRRERRNEPKGSVEIVTADEIVGNMRSIEEVMQELQEGRSVPRSAAALPVKLFVGSLSDETNNARLRAHFEPYGTIAEAVVISDRDSGRSRGFGFVTFADRKDAPRAIDELNHSELDGRRIVVSVATERR